MSSIAAKAWDGEDSGISDPFNATHEQHVDFELKWAGTKVRSNELFFIHHPSPPSDPSLGS
jgi:hypothetical protein